MCNIRRLQLCKLAVLEFLLELRKHSAVKKRHFVSCETYLNKHGRRQSVVLIYVLRQDDSCLQRPELEGSLSGARTDKQR